MIMKRIHWLIAGTLTLGCVGMVWAAVKYVPYQNQDLGFGVKVPSDWLLKVTPKAVGFTGPGDGDERPAVGILKSSVTDTTIVDAANKEYKQKHKPSDWKQMSATLAGSAAIKIVTSQNGKKQLEYYVNNPSGSGYYLIFCIAPEDRWAMYNDIFATILRTFHFLQAA